MTAKTTVMAVSLCAFLCATPLAGGALITSVTDSNSVAAISGGVTSQRENDQDGSLVPFNEDVFSYTDRTAEYNGARYRSSDGVLATAGDVIVGLPSYLIGGEYVSTRNNNRTQSPFGLNVTVSQDVWAYLLIDNRVGDGVMESPPTLGSGGSGVMSWVTDDGWVLYDTGLFPNAPADYVGIDEGGTPSNWAARTHLATVGPGQGVDRFSAVYRKSYQIGATIMLKEQNNGSLNMYGLVVTPEPATVALLAVGALGVLSGRRRSC